MSNAPNEIALRDSIRRSFPAEAYTGRITRYDDADNPEMDDEKELYKALSGRKWTEVPKELLRSQPDGYELLTEEAFAAFLAAWLMDSLENIDGENEVRNFLVYAFSPREGLIPDMTGFKIQRLRCLSPEQRQTLRLLLSEFVERERSSYQKKLASAAVALIDGLGTPER
ncbi:MAG TPA: hypothetical protein VLA96_14700 [Terriglobales bacterium]|nr:hypothetical protein [Terriglobales bacterium]